MITTIILIALAAIALIVVISLGSTIILCSKALMIGFVALILVKAAKRLFFPDGVKRKKKGDDE
jgi:hypothetical protein